MDKQKAQFDRMLEAMMAFVEGVNESHAGGVRFGSNTPLYPAEIHTVVAIGRNQGISLTGLAEELGITKPTLSERIRKLVNKGFVEKRTNPNDRKAVTLWLTPDGITADHHHALHHEEMYAGFCRHFGEDAPRKIAAFTRTFEELSRLNKDACGDA